jgi:hypothetical protein
VVNEPIGALADLQLGRAYALESRSLRGVDADAARAKARAAYQDFLALWKNADPDIPIFKQAEAEYARLGYERNGILIPNRYFELAFAVRPPDLFEQARLEPVLCGFPHEAARSSDDEKLNGAHDRIVDPDSRCWLRMVVSLRGILVALKSRN